MNIQNLKTPFYHTVIHNIFSADELAQISKELAFMTSFKLENRNDEHHNRLLKENNTLSFSLDEFYSTNRNDRNILRLARKVYDLYNEKKLSVVDNPYLAYIPSSNADNTFIQAYTNGSSYYEHPDLSVLTFLFVIEGAEKFEGGKLHFTTHDYYPDLPSNSCIIFPSFEMHELTPIKTESDSVVRISINHRIFITPERTK